MDRVTADSPELARDSNAVARIRATTIWSLTFAFVLMLAAAAVTTRAAAGIAIVLGLGLTGAGFIVGILFSMPRALAPNNANSTAAEPADGNAPASPRPASMYSINTNLEQVSDWLTKIIVGVGLVEAQKHSHVGALRRDDVGRRVQSGTAIIGCGRRDGAGNGMIIGFPVIGFLLGFFSVRLYISRAVHAADATILDRPPIAFGALVTARVTDLYMKKMSVPPSAPPDAASSSVGDASGSSAVDEALSTPLDRLERSDDLIVRGRAALLRGRFEEAVTAFDAVMRKGNADVSIVLDFARALMNLTPPPWSRIVALLEGASASTDDSSPPDVRRQITWELMNALLYTPPPRGFTVATRIGEQYIAGDGREDPYAYVYLAVSHGQAYSYRKKRRDLETAEAQVPQVAQAIQNALKFARAEGIVDGIRRWLSLASGGTEDDDLKELFTDHPEFWNLLKEDND